MKRYKTTSAADCTALIGQQSLFGMGVKSGIKRDPESLDQISRISRRYVVPFQPQVVRVVQPSPHLVQKQSIYPCSCKSTQPADTRFGLLRRGAC